MNARATVAWLYASLCVGLAGCATDAGEAAQVGESVRVRCINTSMTIGGFCMHPDHPDLVRVGFHYSNDFGRTFWIASEFPGDANLLEREGGALCTGLSEQAGDGRLYGQFDTSANTFGRSDDGGATWRRLPTPAPIGQGLRQGIVGYGARAVFFDLHDLYRSTDAGESFEQIPTPNKAKAVIAAYVGPDGMLAVDAWTDGLFLSDDFGDSWRKLDFAPVGRFAVSPEGEIWVVEDIRPDMGITEAGGIWHSTDRAASFRRRVPRWGPFDWRGGVDEVGFGFDQLLALGRGKLAMAGRVPAGGPGRGPLLCVMGPEEPDDPGPVLPSAPPAALTPGTMAPYAYVTDQIAATGAIAISPVGVAWWTFGGSTVDTIGGNFFTAEQKDVITSGCGGSELPLPYRVRDLRYDNLDHRLYVLADPDSYFPQDYVNLPDHCVQGDEFRGPRVWSFSGLDGALVANKAVAPTACVPSGSPIVNPLAKCSNQSCEPVDLFYCPADCGKGGLCGNKTCDPWEQLHCKADCQAPYDGLCGNLKCDDETFEPLFCPYDCPPPLAACPKAGVSAHFVRPRAFVPPRTLVNEHGVSPDAFNTSVRSALYPPLGHAITALANGELLVLRDGWIRRHAIDAPDPCERADRAPSAQCHPSPSAEDRNVLGLAVSQRTGHLYAVIDVPPSVVRRKLDGSTDWEVVVVALLRPLGIDLFESGDTTVLAILDGDVWFAAVGEALPLVRRF